MMSDENKLTDQQLTGVTGGTGSDTSCGLSDVIYEPTHDITACDGSIGNVIYEPTHDLDKAVKNITGAVKKV